MTKYLGETPVEISQTPYADFTKLDFILEYVGRFGQIDGAHHKLWVLDQVARIANNAPIVEMRKAEWDDGTVEYRYEVGTCKQYEDWVEQQKGAYDEELEECEYGYDEGIPP